MLKALAHLFLRLGGFKPEGERPTEPRFVMIAAPHTSNWDLPYMIAFGIVFDVKLAWMGKRQIFSWPFGPIMRRMGGIPVIRERRTNAVDAMAKTVVDAERPDERPLALVVPAEGTRAWAPYWKSGFYHIARKAGVPIVLCHLDYKTRRGGFGPTIHPCGDIEHDMDLIREYYEGRTGKVPENFGPIRLKEEDSQEEDSQ
jgi:1-acyl-sn-glycerol-3-phosphate acyltransferase